MVTLVVILSGCVDKSATTPDLVINDPNRVFNCWKQKWNCGDWTTLKDEPDRNTYMVWMAKGDLFGGSFCEYCSVDRIIHLNDKKERILYDSTKPDQRRCKHLWKKGFTGAVLCSDNIREGDGFAVYRYDNRIIIVLVKKIEHGISIDGTDNSYVLYKYTKLRRSDVEEGSTKVKWDFLLWKEAKCQNYFLFENDIKIPVEFSYLEKEKQTVFAVEYPTRYGGCEVDYKSLSGQPYKIAIIDKKDITGKTIDLSQCHFKFWQDGMGNKCDGK
ncbi:MAG: hypothetical protein WC454_06380 [Phycisphaerae bacterium]|jgi:hypothetical protein